MRDFMIFMTIFLAPLAVLVVPVLFESYKPQLRKVRPYIQPVRHNGFYARPDQVQFLLVTAESGFVFKRYYGERYETEQAAEKARIAILERELELGENVVSLRDRIESKRGRL